MGQFHHYSGTVAVRVGDEQYSDTFENFLTDYGQPVPGLPAGAKERIYDQGKRHTLHDTEGSVIATMDAECPRECPWADAVIGSIYTLLRRQIARQTEAEVWVARNRGAAKLDDVKAREAAAAAKQ